jgi:hypothetical protein
MPTPPPTPDPAQAKSGDWEREKRGIQADLAKERKSRQQFEQQVQQHQTELALERKRIQALTGVNPLSAEDSDAADIRARFGKVFSREQLLEHLGMSADDLADLKSAKEDRERLKTLENQHWTKHNSAVVKEVTAEISKAYGGTLNDKQKDNILKLYVLRAQSDPEFLARHEDGDPTLVKEFAQEFLTNWFEPAKRSALAAEVGQFRRVPNGQSRGIVQQGEKAIDVKDPKAVEDMLVAGFRERGGQFGRNR